jgi:type I restriction enzyme S subunit
LTSDQQRHSEVENNSEGSSGREYEEVALSEVVDPVLGKTPKRKKDEYWEGNVKWASAKDISQNSTRKIYDTAEYMTAEGKDASNAKKMPEGTLVVIARGATMGRSAQLGEPMTFNQTCYGLDADNNKLLDDFLYYIWQYRFNQIQSVSHGTVFDTITMDSFKDIDIPLPDLETQKKICNVLTSIDNKIEINNRVIRISEEIGKSLFRSRFIEFEPYEKFKQSELGKIPTCFEVMNLTDIADVTYGYSFSSEKFNEDKKGMPIIRIRNISDDTVDKYSPESFDDEYLVQPGDVLAGMDGEFRSHIWKGPKAGLNQRACKFEGKDSLYSEMYLWNAVKRPLYKLEKSKTGTTVIHLGKRDIDDIILAVPDRDSLSQFNSALDPIYQEMINLRQENRDLKNLRETLLPKLMSGEIRVNDIQLDELEVDSEV